MLPGDSLDPGSAGGDMSAIEIQALTDTTLAVIEGRDWTRLLNQHPDIGRAVNRAGKAATWRMCERMLRLGKGSAERSIAFTLCELLPEVDGSWPHRGPKVPHPDDPAAAGRIFAACRRCMSAARSGGLERNGILTVTRASHGHRGR